MNNVNLAGYKNTSNVSFQGAKTEALRKFVLTIPPKEDVKKAVKIGLAESGALALSLGLAGGNPIGALIIKFFLVDSPRTAIKGVKLNSKILKLNPEYNFNDTKFTKLLVKENPFNLFSQFIHNTFKIGSKVGDKLEAYAIKHNVNPN